MAPGRGGLVLDSDLAPVARIGDWRTDPFAAPWSGFSTVVYWVIAGNLPFHRFESQKAVLACDRRSVRAIMRFESGRFSVDESMTPGCPTMALHSTPEYALWLHIDGHWPGASERQP